MRRFIVAAVLSCLIGCTSYDSYGRPTRGATGRAVWSLIIPGVGQFMNEQPLKGLLMLGINVGTNVGYRNALEEGDRQQAGTFVLVNLANGIWSCADAYSVANYLNRTQPLMADGDLYEPYALDEGHSLVSDAGASDGAESPPLIVVLDPFTSSASAVVHFKF
jgi:hypothetical protein